MSIEQLTEEALSLPDNLKLKLVEKLLESLESTIDREVQAECFTLAQQRRNEIRDGLVVPIPGEEALKHGRRYVVS